MREKRSGFTMIELLMIILIIGILIALLMPAIGSVRNNMRVTEVRQEISQLDSAIADFAFKMGHEPPSQITLYESWTAGWDADSQSRAKIRKIWPKYDFMNVVVDLNGDGDTNDYFNLRGDQCLVFFLGGVYDRAKKSLTGFSGNPTDPFENSTGTRIGPFYEFDHGRVAQQFGVDYVYSDDGAVPSGDSTEFFPVYLDPLKDQSRPYIYVSSYSGIGYYDGPQMDSDANTFSAMSESASGFRAYRLENGEHWKSSGHQIISPGWDGRYGSGGVFMDGAKTQLPSPDPTKMREDEYDNITNFSRGMLQP